MDCFDEDVDSQGNISIWAQQEAAPLVPPEIQIPDEEDLDMPRIFMKGHIYKEMHRTVDCQAMCFTHHAHDGCEMFPKSEACIVKRTQKRPQVGVLGGGFGQEVCPTTGRVHVQGWVVFKQLSSFGAIKASFCDKIHWEKMRGSVAQNIRYCSKEGQYVGFGDQHCTNPHKGQGRRSDLDEIKGMILAGATKAEINNKHFGTFVRYSSGIEKSIQNLACHATVPKEFHILIGPAGTGKTWAARKIMERHDANFDISHVYQPMQNNSGLLSFETYQNQKWILLDDFEPGTLGAGPLKRMTDKFGFGAILPGRGCSVPSRAYGVIITSNHPLEVWYQKSAVEVPAIKRRADSIKFYGPRSVKNLKTGEEEPNECPFLNVEEIERDAFVVPNEERNQNVCESDVCELHAKRRRIH